MPASSSSSTRPPTISVLCTTLIVCCSAVSGNSMYSCIGRFAVPNGAPTMRNVVRPDARSTV